MPYRSAILAAIEDLKDHQTGSPASSLRRRIKEHDPSFAAAVASSDDATTWNETLFQSTLRSLVSKGTLVQINGANYKFADAHLKARAAEFRARADSIEERRHERMEAAHPREAPPKGSPARKAVHAKVKLNEGRIITVVNLEGRRHGEDDMETDDEEGDATDGIGSGGEGHKRPVRIIPRKKVPLAKKMCVRTSCYLYISIDFAQYQKLLLCSLIHTYCVSHLLKCV